MAETLPVPLNEILEQIYGKCPKLSNTLFYTFLAQILLFMQMFPKVHVPNGMANSVNPDQTAPSGAVLSGSTLFA